MDAVAIAGNARIVPRVPEIAAVTSVRQTKWRCTLSLYSRHFHDQLVSPAAYESKYVYLIVFGLIGLPVRTRVATK